jgi:hypothetical protein
LAQELKVLGYCLGAPAVLYGDVVNSVNVYHEHGTMAGDGILAIETRMIQLDSKPHSFESNLFELRANPSLTKRNQLLNYCQ